MKKKRRRTSSKLTVTSLAFQNSLRQMEKTISAKD